MKEKSDTLKNNKKLNLKDEVINRFNNTSTFRQIHKLDNEKKFFGFIIIILGLLISRYQKVILNR